MAHKPTIDEYHNAPIEEWSKIARGNLGNHVFSKDGHKSCFDCDNMRVRCFPRRACVVHQDRHIWSSIESEIEENGITVADTCDDFKWDIRLDMFPMKILPSERK